jgi:uncharacterized protein (TIGR03435 family)
MTMTTRRTDNAVAVCILAGAWVVVSLGGQHARAQSRGNRTFASATVGPGSGMERNPRVDHGRFAWHGAFLPLLVRYAYDLQDAQIVGNVPVEAYDIDATYPASSTPADIKEMVKSLLRDRFGFRSHSETRKMPVFRLVVGPSGHKLAKAQDPPVVVVKGRTLPPNTMRGMAFDDGYHFAGAGVTVRQIADSLADILKRPVLDETHVAGLFNVDVVYAKEGPAPQGAALPTLPTAIQQKLGLQLQDATASVEILVVDQIKAPSNLRDARAASSR